MSLSGITTEDDSCLPRLMTARWRAEPTHMDHVGGDESIRACVQAVGTFVQMGTFDAGRFKSGPTFALISCETGVL